MKEVTLHDKSANFMPHGKKTDNHDDLNLQIDETQTKDSETERRASNTTAATYNQIFQ